MKVEVVFLPPIATDLESKVCVAIDVLRATSTLVTMFGAGVRRIHLAESVEKALALAATLSPRPVVCGEVGGLPPVGFDRGNSPREYPRGTLEGNELVFFTSNGTKALRQIERARVVLAGSMLNGHALVRTALRESTESGLDISFVCSGDFVGTRFAIDDAFCAGYLCSLVEAGSSSSGGPADRNAGREMEFDESALAALRLYRSYFSTGAGSGVREERAAILAAFWESHNALVLRKVGLAEDVDFCAQLDISEVVPRLSREGDSLVLYPEPASEKESISRGSREYRD